MPGNNNAANSGNVWKPMLICPHKELGEGLTVLWLEAEQTGSITASHEYPSALAFHELVASQAPNLCFLDVGSNPEKAMDLLGQMRTLGLPVVALHTHNESELILNCLRHGSAEFLYLPFSSDQFSLTLERILKRAQSVPRSGGQVFAFMRGKAGCGSTTIACNIAFQIQALKFERVLLADLDPLTGTIAFLLKLNSNYSFVHALANSSRLDEALWKGMVTPSRGVDVLLSPEMPVDMVYEPEDLAAMVNYWRQVYDFVILDTPGPQRDWGLSLARLCDEIVLLATNELPAIHATQNTLACLDHNGISRSKVKLVINRFNADLGLTGDAVESALDLKVFHQLPSDYEGVQKALMEGKPVPAGTKVGKGILELAEKLTGRKGQPRRQSLFGGLFSAFE